MQQQRYTHLHLDNGPRLSIDGDITTGDLNGVPYIEFMSRGEQTRVFIEKISTMVAYRDARR